MNRVLPSLALLFLCYGSSVCHGQTLLYLNFDHATMENVRDGAEYLPGPNEVTDTEAAGLGKARLTFISTSGSASIKEPPANVNGGRQGGNCLLLSNGPGCDDGLRIAVEKGLYQQSFTMEAVWFSTDSEASSGDADYQAILGNDWPEGCDSRFSLRAAGPEHLEVWNDRTASGSECGVTTKAMNMRNTWYHDVLVYAYNTTAPAASSLRLYRNGQLLREVTYDAQSGQEDVLFGRSLRGLRTLTIGCSNGLGGQLSGHQRGITGGIDAVAVSLGALAPGQFVLPRGAAIGLAGIPKAHSGRYAMWMTLLKGAYENSAGDSGIDNDPESIKAVPGHVLRISIWARSTDPLHCVLRELTVAEFAGKRLVRDVPVFRRKRIPMVWTNLVAYHTVDVSVNRIVLGLRCNAAGDSVIVDDVSVLDETARDRELVTNGGFEDWSDEPNVMPTGWRFFSVPPLEGRYERAE